ncbi:MAG TPA: HAMP domain-containing sensor histidine kinase [Candidatus Dormibacteraeota bacterium]|nr:HAMP domain-containing sensor histidine kinase [Candidatus Dormibacteraeota bacterium]
MNEPVRGSGGPSVRTLSIRVALTATAIVGAAYLAIAIAVAAFITTSLTNQVDSNLAHALNGRVPPPNDGGFEGPGPDHPLGLPIAEWVIGPDGTVLRQSDTSVDLPVADRAVTDARTVSIGGQDIRIMGTRIVVESAEYHLVVGQSMTSVSQTQSTLVAAEVGIGALLLLAVFLGAVAIGRRVAGPIDRARQRQLDFTADASHELRTPLSVIEAETSLALARDRPVEWYRTSFGRIDGESRRMRRLVEDMLWLARFDATQGQPDAEPVDVDTLAAQTVDRFRAIAEARHLSLGLDASRGAAIVTVPPEWLDRLVGVLLDNACKYSPDGGAVRVAVLDEGRRVRLTVDDSGPGIPEEERERVFDRFRRATDAPGGSGLGLAIGDAIVRATNGRWHIGTSPQGGASISVTWLRWSGGGREGRTEPSHADGRADAQARP